MTAAGPTGFELLDEQRDGASLALRFRVPAGLDCLEGHFPDFPLVPGVAQLGLAAEATARLRGPDLQVVGLEAVKFRQLVRPGDEFELRVEAPPERDRAVYRVVLGDREAATGRLCLAREASPLPATAEPGLLEAVPGADLDAREVLPQQGPMAFLERVLRAEERRTACSFRVDALTLFRDASGALPAWCGIEPMAQCIAAHGGLEARRRAQPPPVGFLLGTRRLRIGVARLAAGVTHVVVAEQVWGGDHGLVSFDCALYERDSGACLLAGRINAYLPSDLAAVLEGGLGGQE